jgi:hypothetical protein
MMNAQIGLNILIDAAHKAQRAGALTLDQAVDVRDAIVFFQKPAPAPAPKQEPESAEVTE